MESRELVLGDRYEVLASIGSGTAANVYRVRDRWTGATRAAKMLKAANAGNPRVLARFEDEFRILRTLHHPHLPEVYDYGWTADGGRFLIMELVDGVPLAEFFRSHPTDIWAILYELCETLTFVHNRKLLHQDIKPSNILVKRTTAFGPELPLIKLIDFGLTFRRDTGAAVELVGTPEYMAPEVIRGEPNLTRAVDYYSLGATLFELLTGKPPFVGAPNEVLRAHLEREPVIEEEVLEWAELYPHVRALLTKDSRPRLEAFEELRRAVVSRLTGGIEELDRAYRLALMDSLPIAGKEEAWEEVLDILRRFATGRIDVKVAPLILRCGVDARGEEERLLGTLIAEAQILGVASRVIWEESGGFGATRREIQSGQLWNEIEFASRTNPLLIIVDATSILSSSQSEILSQLITSYELSAATTRTRVAFVEVAGSGQDTSVLGSLLPQSTSSVFALELHSPRADPTKETWCEADTMRVRKSTDREPRVAVLNLSNEQREILACLSCHPTAVRPTWVSTLTTLPESVVESTIDQLTTRRLVEQRGAAGEVSIRSESLKSDIYRSLPKGVRLSYHESLEQLLSTERGRDSAGGMEDWRASVFHLERLGKERDVLRMHTLVVARLRRERQFHEIEAICRNALSRLSSRRQDAGLPLRWYMRQLVDCLWARNLTVQAYHAIHHNIVSLDKPLPSSLRPKFIRGMMDALGPDSALSYLRETMMKPGDPIGLRLRVSLEEALCVYNLGRYRESLGILTEIANRESLLSERDRCRMRMYRAMNMFAIGQTANANRLLRDSVRRATEHDLVDEFALAQVLIAVKKLNDGDGEAALAIVSRALRIVSRHQLLLRQYQLFSQAAGAYSDLGDNERAVRWRTKTVLLAERLGHQQFLGASWLRLAMYKQRHGLYGDAVRYYDRAMSLLDQVSTMLDRAKGHLWRYECHIVIGSARVESLSRSVQTVMASVEDIGEQGMLAHINAKRCLREGQTRRALTLFRNAQASFKLAGRSDDVVRSCLGEARARLEHDDITGAVRATENVSSQIDRVKGGDITAQRALILLLLAVRLRRSRKTIRIAARNCESAMVKADMATRLDLLGALFMVYARLGLAERAARAFKQRHECVRLVAANLSDELVGDFVTAAEMSGLFREYGAVTRAETAHAAEPEGAAA